MLACMQVPAYLCKPHVPAYLHRVAPWAIVIFILRNSVDRAYSEGQMEANTLPAKHRRKPRVHSFQKRIEENARILQVYRWIDMPKLGNFRSTPDRFFRNHTLPMTLAERHAVVAYGHEHRSKFQMSLLQCGSIGRGMYAQQLMGWIRYYTLNENLLVVRFEDFVANGTAVLEKIHQFIGLDDPHVTVGKEDFEKTFIPVRRSSNQETGGIEDDIMREYLTELYKPFNAELADLLGEEWRGVWD